MYSKLFDVFAALIMIANLKVLLEMLHRGKHSFWYTCEKCGSSTSAYNLGGELVEYL
jgi:hypothetical protein